MNHQKITAMRKNFVTFVWVLVCTSFFSSMTCLTATVVRENRETGTFRKISTGGGIDVYFTQSESYSVVVEADDDLVDKISTAVDGETLVIKRKEDINWSLFNNKIQKVHVSAPAIHKVSVMGGADFYTNHLKCEDSFQLDVSGGADAHIKHLASAKNVDISVSGGADADIETLTVSGNTHISVAAGADCEVDNLQTVDCDLSASGGADLDVSLTVSGNLNIQSSGGADVDVEGKANKVKIVASGGADVSVKKLSYGSMDLHKSGGGSIRTGTSNH
jgi:hypothetical protein